MRTFRAVEHRLEFVRSVGGIDFYNDSKATSVDATLKALDAFAGGLWVILGGKDKGLDYSLLREPLAAKAHAALLIGAAAGKIADAAGGGACRWWMRKTLAEAVAYGYRNGTAGDTVLLAPACASFDQFRSYEHRGEVFKEIVNRLEPKELNGATPETDWILFGTVLLMVSFGLLILYSASSIMAQLDPRYGSSWHFVIRQVEWAVVAMGVMMTLKKTSYRKFNNSAVAFGAIGICLLLLVAVYFVDATHHRWLRLGGPVGVQPSELAKPALVVFLAFFVAWRGARHQQHPVHAGSGGAGGRAGAVRGGGGRPGNGGGAGAGGGHGVSSWRAWSGAIAPSSPASRSSAWESSFTAMPTAWRAWCVSSIRSSRFITRFDPHGTHQDAHGEIAGHARHQLPVAAIEDRGGRRRAHRASA